MQIGVLGAPVRPAAASPPGSRRSGSTSSSARGRSTARWRSVDRLLEQVGRPRPRHRRRRQRGRGRGRPRRDRHPVGRRRADRQLGVAASSRARSSSRWPTPSPRSATSSSRSSRPEARWPRACRRRVPEVAGGRRLPPRAGQGARRPRPPGRERRADLLRPPRGHRGHRRDRAGRSPTCARSTPASCRNAAPIEAFAAVLLQLNVRYKTRVAVKFTGIDASESDPRPAAIGVRGDRAVACRRDAPLRHGSPRRSSRSSRVRSSRCTRAASRRTTPPTSGTPPSYVTYDVLQRRLRDLGHETRCVRNITDVDDSILLRKARELGVHYLDLAAAEIARFDGDMLALNVHRVLERAPGHLRHRRHPRLHRHGARPGLRLRGRWRGLLRRVDRFDRFGQVATTRASEMLELRGRAGRQRRRSQQARPARLRAVAAVGARRAGLGVAVGPRSPGLAHRVLGAGAARARHHHRPARRRLRPDLPAPRVRGGPVRGRHRRAVRPPLDAPGHGPHGRREDVEVARQPRVRQRPAQDVGPAGHPPGARRAPLPHRVGVGRRAACPAPPPASTAGSPPPSPALRAAPRSTRCERASTTTSTRPARSPPSTPASPSGDDVVAAAALLGVFLTA